MQNIHPKLGRFMLAGACRRAGLIVNPDEGSTSDEPCGLVVRVKDRSEATRDAEEAYAMALEHLAGFGPHWTPILDDVRRCWRAGPCAEPSRPRLAST